jgi:CRISPR-associated protein (TIGR02710 family)
MNGQPAVLVCTVGGSPQPILSALRARRWEHVVFVCTRDEDGAAGSAELVESAAAGGPPLPERAGLAAGQWDIVSVPPDDPDRAFAALAERLHGLMRAHPGAAVIADFTGGTKSMSAALMLAALDAGAELQLVAGRRVDLVRVLDRSERAIAVPTLRIAAGREFERLAAGWERFAYQQAAEGLARLRNDLKKAGLPRAELGRYARAQELSEAFAAWDRFDHKRAAGALRRYEGLAIAGRDDWCTTAARLAGGQGAPWGALHLRDLWHNAERCAARGRYDDAVARLYRLWEAIAQWLLRTDCRIDTRVIETGLRKSWDLYLHLRPDGAAAAFWRRPDEEGRSELDRLGERLSVRNLSILAHGWNAIDERGWNALAGWTRSGLLGVLACEAERLGEPHLLSQLPNALPAL